MISESVNVKTNYHSKKPTEQIKMSTKKDASGSKLDSNLGLKKPGSNWEKFKNLLVEGAPNETDDDYTQIKKKKRDVIPFHKSNEATPKITGANKQKITKPDTKQIEKEVPVYKGLTRCVAMDCEMVGINNGSDSMIARVSIVNKNGYCVYDKYVKPTEEIKDYRTAVSGIRPCHLEKGEDFKIVQKEVADILKGRILVGHALHNDLAVLFLSHAKRLQRDTSRYKFFKKINKGNTPSLKKLASELLGVDIQSGEHNSIEDAQTAMQLYQLYRKKWENDIRTRG